MLFIDICWDISGLTSKSVVVTISFRENLFEEVLQEKEEIAVKRKRCKEILRVLQQGAWVLSSPAFSNNFVLQII